jgi:hypothetical protein
MPIGCWTIRLPAPAVTFRVSTRPSRFPPSDRPPLHLRSTGSSSRELRASLEYVANRIPCDPCEPQDPPWRFASPSRHPHLESTNSRLPTTHLMVRPRRFSRPRRVTPLGALQAYFILLPRAGLLFRDFPRSQAAPPLDGRSPHDVKRRSPPALQPKLPNSPDPAAPPTGCCS